MRWSAPGWLTPVAVVLVVALGVGSCSLRSESGFEQLHRAAVGVRDAVREAGSVTMHFDAEVTATRPRPDTVLWQGTTRARYGDEPASETEFTTFLAARSDPDAPGGRATSDIDLRRVVIGPVGYYRSDALETPTGRPWVRLERGSDLTFGQPWDLVNPNLGIADPQWYLAMLSVLPRSANLRDLERTEEVDGVATRLYDLNCALAEPSCPHPDESDPVRRLFPGLSVIQLRFWLDDDGRPRRFEVKGDLGSGAYRLTATMTFAEFGEPVEIGAPPANQVTEWPP